MGMADHSMAERICKKFKITLPKQALVKTGDQAVKAAKKIGYPVAMKVSSPNIVHKTEAGGLFLGIKTEKELRETFKRLKENTRKAKARFGGVLVQEMVSGVETIIGAKQDATFGPVVMFGLGGIFV